MGSENVLNTDAGEEKIQFSLLLGTIYQNKPGYVVYNSNRPVYAEGCVGSRTGVFNADGMVVALPRKSYEYSPGLSAETTPTLLIEILSPSTEAYDLATKLPCYKEIPSVQTILYVRQNQPDITVTERQGPDQWLETRLHNLTDPFGVGGKLPTLTMVYQGVFS